MNLVLLVLDVEVVEYFPLFGLGLVGVGSLRVEFPLPDLNFTIFLLNQLDKVFVLVDEMCVLGQQQFDFLLQIVNFLTLSDLEHQLLIDPHQLRLELTHPHPPILHVARGVGLPSRRILIGPGTGCPGVALVGRVVLPAAKVADRAVSHV